MKKLTSAKIILDLCVIQCCKQQFRIVLQNLLFSLFHFKKKMVPEKAFLPFAQ